MSRGRRIETVVRIRGLQARIAESEAVRSRGEADRRRAAVERAVDDLAARSDTFARPAGVDALQRRHEVLASAVDTIGMRQELHVRADHEFAEAHRVWLDAHRRHEAIERLHDRTVADDLAEQGRIEQIEIDEHVTVRHGREHNTHPEEEQ